jgi:hypothetical protein
MVTAKPIPEWCDKVKQWQTSGKSIKAWCQEQNIPLPTFYGWKKRYESHPSSPTQEKQFIELKDKPKHPGIVLEFLDVKIYLTENFNEALLKRCLATLRDYPC